MCSYPVMELCTKHLSQHIATLKVSSFINVKVVVYYDVSYTLSIEQLKRHKHELYKELTSSFTDAVLVVNLCKFIQILVQIENY